jgi:hypothetical protein
MKTNNRLLFKIANKCLRSLPTLILALWLISQTLVSRGGFISRWWDIVEDRLDTPYCKANLAFSGTSFLLTSCENVYLAKWLKTALQREKVETLSVLPAQTLYYRVLPEATPFPGLVVGWNDFANFEYQIRLLKTCLYEKSNCPANLDSILLIPTSPSTMKGSWQNFGDRDNPLGYIFFPQQTLENLIINYSGSHYRKLTYLRGGKRAILLIAKKNR